LEQIQSFWGHVSVQTTYVTWAANSGFVSVNVALALSQMLEVDEPLWKVSDHPETP